MTATTEDLDLEGALERMGGDLEMLLELIQLFLEGVPDSLAKLREACRNGDAAGVEQVAHSLRGAAGSLGAAAVYETAGQLEAISRGHTIEGVAPLVDELENRLNRFAERVDTLA